jgi:hypothetical protein
MESSPRFNWLIKTERRRLVVVILFWAGSLAAIFAQAVFQRTTLTGLDYLLGFGISLAAGAIIQDIGKAVIGYALAMPLGMTILFLLAILPALTGAIQPPGDVFVTTLWIAILFRLVLPFQFMLYFAGAIIGAIAGEYYFY